MRALLVLALLAVVAATDILSVPQECADPKILASIVNIWGKCKSADKSIDALTCTVKGCDGVKEGEADTKCPDRNTLKYSCDLTGKHGKLVDDNGCFLCDYATPVKTPGQLTPSEKCPILQTPKCAAGVKPQFKNGCPLCRPNNGVGDSSSTCSSQQVAACAQRLGNSLKYCPQSAAATVDSQCCPSCKPVCQGAPSPFPLEESSSVQLSAHTAWNKMKHNIDVFVWPPNGAQFAAPNGWPGGGVGAGNDFLKCSGGGGFNPNGGGGGNSGGGGGGGGNPNSGGGGGGGNGGDNGRGTNGGDSGDEDNTGGGPAPSDNGGNGDTAACTQAQKDACNQKVQTLPTCAAGTGPEADSTGCCITCRPDNNKQPAPSAELDIKSCSDDEVYQCQLHTSFCKDTESQIGFNSMCCKHCRRHEDLCSPLEVAKFYASAPACVGKKNAQHVEGLCGPTCVPEKVLCNPNCKSNQLCLMKPNGKAYCVDAYETTLVVKNGGAQYLSDLAGLTLDQASFYLREVATRYCEIPQVNDECVKATKSIASLEVVKVTRMADGAVQMVVLMKGDVEDNNPTSLLVSAIQRKFAIAGDMASENIKVVSIVRALPKESASSAAGIIAGVAAGVVALLAVLGFFLYRRYQARGEKHTATTTHIEMATTTKA